MIKEILKAIIFLTIAYCLGMAIFFIIAVANYYWSCAINHNC